MAKHGVSHTDPDTTDQEAASEELLGIEAESMDSAVDEVEREDKESEDDTEKTEKGSEPHLHKIEQPNALRRFGAWFWRKKFITVPLVVLVVIAILLAIPITRYGMTSWFWKESVTIQVTDEGNGRPVTEATVTLAGQTVKTDTKGAAQFSSIPVGSRSLIIAKKNYTTLSNTIEVPLFARGKVYADTLHATGRVSDIVVTNKISGKAIKAALITITKDDQARTDENGKTQVVVPADKQEITATVSADGYLDTPVTIKQAGSNQLQLTPTGKLYFLSKQSGTIDIVQTNLDGTERKTVVAGTGLEDDRNTTLLASQDWRYLLLEAKRTAGKPGYLYLYDTVKGSFELVDQSNADFNLIGWSGHNFFYRAIRHDRTYTDAGYTALRFINADTRKMTVVDENQAVTTGYNAFYVQRFDDDAYIVDDGLIYSKSWYSSASYVASPTDKTADIVRIASDGTNKKTLKSYPSASVTFIQGKLYKPQDIYFSIYNSTADQNDQTKYSEYEDGSYHDGADGSKFNSDYPTFLISPAGSQAFWSESRDGKNTLLLGDKEGNNGQVLASASEYKPYGWFTDGYLLMQKSDSELYITTADQLKAGNQPIKVSDYHKPIISLTGYGYGYGGL